MNIRHTIAALALLLLVSVSGRSQGGLVTGKVIDDTGEPVVGGAIYYEGLQTVNAVTNFNGEYTIKAMPGKVLVFTCIGLKDEKVTVQVAGRLDVRMQTDGLFLDDAVVVGYGTQQRGDLTGSISSVKAHEIRQGGTPDLLGSLQGRVAGLSITSQSGEPGAGYSISIRGNNSINASTAPLIVVDGMQMDVSSEDKAGSSLYTSGSDPLSFLNPSDIKSIEVLKDASATAIYGSRGAGGVILITTKDGASDSGRTSVTFDGTFGISGTARDLDMLDGQEWINYRFERGDHEYRYFGKDTDGDGIEDTPKTLADYGRTSVNWRDVMLRKAASRQYGLSVRANAGKDTKILANLGYLDQQGLIIGNGYSKYTGKLKLDHSVSGKLKVGANVNYARTKSEGAATSSGGSFSTQGLIQLIYLEKPVDRFSDPDDASSSYTNSTSIYDCISSETSRTGISDRAMGNIHLDWTILPSLTLRTYGSADILTSSNNEFYSANTRWGHSNNGVAQVGFTRSTGFTANTTLTWRPELKGKLSHFNAMGGAELGQYTYESYSQMAVDFEDPTLRDLALASGTLKNPSQSKTDNARMSAFGRADYNFDYRYYLSLNFRADASSKFSEDSRVGYFPSVSAAWKVSNEPWAKVAKRKWLDNLKFRLSAGASGNDRISSYSNLSTVSYVYYSDGAGSQIIGSAGKILGNPDLKWETTYQYDLGLDLTLFKGRVDLVADAYYKDTRDMLFMATLPSQTGYTSQWRNIGRVENKGLELTLNTVNVKRGDFSWNSSFTFFSNANKVLSLGDGVDVVATSVGKGAFKDEPTRLMVGQPIGIIWGYVWDGNYQLDDFDIYFRGTDIPVDSGCVTSDNYSDFDYVLRKGVTQISGVNPKPGDRKLKDLDGDGVVTESKDKKVLGKSSPDFTYGIANTFSWKGLSLYLFFDGVQGKDIFNAFKYSCVAGEIENYTNITRDAYYNAWRPENGSNKHARLTNQTNCQSAVSSYFVEDGSFLKLRTVTLSWNLPAGACRTLHMEGLKLSLSATNLYTWTAYSGLDPDVTYYDSTFSCMDRGSYPASRTFTAGVIATF